MEKLGEKSQRTAEKRKKEISDQKKLLEFTEEYQKAVREEGIRKGKLEENRKLEESQKKAFEKAAERFQKGLAVQGFSGKRNTKSSHEPSGTGKCQNSG